MCLFSSITQAFSSNQLGRFRDQFFTFPFKTQNQTKRNFKNIKINFTNFFAKTLKKLLKITCIDFILTNFSRILENKHKKVML